MGAVINRPEEAHENETHCCQHSHLFIAATTFAAEPAPAAAELTKLLHEFLAGAAGTMPRCTTASGPRM
jgi:hypothetical protein